MKAINIAVDGPSGAGKSTLARRLAAKLGYIYVDTGAMYRAIAYHTLRCHAEDEATVTELLPVIHVTLKYSDGVQRVLLNGEDVSEVIRTPEVSMAASRVSAIPAVRECLLGMQRQLAAEQSVVMDGRDIGTVVLPDAQVKIFLTASPEARAERRYEELLGKGMDVKFEDVLADMIQRDYNDSHRAIAPLKPADDAILLDTSGNTLEQSVELVTRTIRENMPR